MRVVVMHLGRRPASVGRVNVSSALLLLIALLLPLHMVIHRVDLPLIGKVDVSSLLCCSLSYARGVMHRFDLPLIGKVNISSSLRCCCFSLSSCAW